MFGDIEMKDFAPTVLNDEETVQELESESGNSKEVHSGYGFTMVAQKSSPKLS